MSFYQDRAYSVLHPTDFSEASEIAFAHALAIAIRNKADLTLLHVAQDSDDDVDWHDFPSVRKTLERWGILEPGSRRSDVEEKTGIIVQKHIAKNRNVVHAIVGLTTVDSFDLLVMSTRGHAHGWIFPKPPASVEVSMKAHLPTLFITEGARSCVDLETGQTSLRKVLIAVDHEPDARPAIRRVENMLRSIGGNESEVTLLYVGAKDDFPIVDLPLQDGVQWSRVVRQGSAAIEILAQAREMDADLIVMVTSGKRQLWEVLSGNTVQNVLKNAPCPVFALPN